MTCRIPYLFAVLWFITLPSFAFAQNAAADEAALDKTDAAVRAGFASADLDAIRRYHHPDVVKALSPGELVVGRDAAVNAIAANLRESRLEFVESKVESSLVMGDSAVRIFHFSIRATPKAGGAPATFTGRSMIVYIRTKDSPTGWATIRELVQAAK
ncbi:MAG TPA: nuclear transport factor 2 family protein [Terracidiphilus sp.]|jgi:ketosteroid isomerase-like protein